MKNLLILLLFVSVISSCDVDFTAPVIKYSNADENKSISTNEIFKIRVEVDDDEATCLWEQTSGPNVFLNNNSKPFSRFSKPVFLKKYSMNLCTLASLKTSGEPGELSFHLTVTNKRGRSSTMTIPITVMPLSFSRVSTRVSNSRYDKKVCDNGFNETGWDVREDDYGIFCCIEDMIRSIPDELTENLISWMTFKCP